MSVVCQSEELRACGIVVTRDVYVDSEAGRDVLLVSTCLFTLKRGWLKSNGGATCGQLLNAVSGRLRTGWLANTLRKQIFIFSSVSPCNHCCPGSAY